MMDKKLVLVNLGCGTVAPESWVNIDTSWNAWLHQIPFLSDFIKTNINWPKNIKIRDITKKLQFENNSVDAVYMSHVLEHLDPDVGKKVLVECLRILKPGKYIRILVPDLKVLSVNYLKESEKKSHSAANNYLASLHIFTPTGSSWLHKIYFFLNNTDSHKWMYDRISLTDILKISGFKNISKRSYLSSHIPLIRQVEQKNRFVNSVCIEAEKQI